MIGKFKIKIVQAKPNPDLNDGKAVVVTELLPWKKIDCRGIKVKKDQWIGSAISEEQGMIYRKKTTLKRRVTHTQQFDQWHNSSSKYQVGNASRVSSDFYGGKRSVAAPPTSKRSVGAMPSVLSLPDVS